MDWIAIVSGFGVGARVGASGMGAGSVRTLQPMPAGTGQAGLGRGGGRLLAARLSGSIPGIGIGTRLTRSMPECIVSTLRCVSPVTTDVKVNL